MNTTTIRDITQHAAPDSCTLGAQIFFPCAAAANDSGEDLTPAQKALELRVHALEEKFDSMSSEMTQIRVAEKLRKLRAEFAQKAQDTERRRREF